MTHRFSLLPADPRDQFSIRVSTRLVRLFGTLSTLGTMQPFPQPLSTPFAPVRSRSLGRRFSSGVGSDARPPPAPQSSSLSLGTLLEHYTPAADFPRRIPRLPDTTAPPLRIMEHDELDRRDDSPISIEQFRVQYVLGCGYFYDSTVDAVVPAFDIQWDVAVGEVAEWAAKGWPLREWMPAYTVPGLAIVGFYRAHSLDLADLVSFYSELSQGGQPIREDQTVLLQMSDTWLSSHALFEVDDFDTSLITRTEQLISVWPAEIHYRDEEVVEVRCENGVMFFQMFLENITLTLLTGYQMLESGELRVTDQPPTYGTPNKAPQDEIWYSV